MSGRASAIIPRALASEHISAKRLAARSAAKPPGSVLASAATARRAALDKRPPVGRKTRSPEVVSPPSVQSTPPSVIRLNSPPQGVGGFSPGAVRRSVAAAIAPLLAHQSSKKLKMAAAPGGRSFGVQ